MSTGVQAQAEPISFEEELGLLQKKLEQKDKQSYCRRKLFMEMFFGPKLRPVLYETAQESQINLQSIKSAK